VPTYNDLRHADDFKKRDYELVFPDMKEEDKLRTLQNLLALREGLDEQIVPRKSEKNLLVASWNIKEFGHTKQRLPEAFFYMAEIISRFDLVVVQEIKSTLKDLYLLQRLLGDDWAYLINDITEGTDGNSERSAFLFNKQRVALSGLAGEIVLWDELTAASPIKQLKRTPYITGFRAGWKSFAMICLHLHPGDDANDIDFRKQEVELLLAAIAKKTKDKHLWSPNLILSGDFNFYTGANKDDPTVALIQAAGYREVEALEGVDTNASLTETYDRLFLASNDYFQVGKNAMGLEQGGVFDPFEFVFKEGQEPIYADYMIDHYTGSKDMTDPARQKKYFKNPWRKNQLSDHFPIWFELITDSADAFLQETADKY
jgi:endonuclease/exonuclease/phosphatase family metal-dependent hydrolase